MYMTLHGIRFEYLRSEEITLVCRTSRCSESCCRRHAQIHLLALLFDSMLPVLASVVSVVTTAMASMSRMMLAL